MESRNLFFYVFYIIYFLQIILIINIIQVGYKYFRVVESDYTEVQYLALYMLVLSVLEFASVMKFYFQLDIGGLIQLIPLKVLRYFHLYVSRLRCQTRVQRLLYLILDLVILEPFLYYSDQAFSAVFNKYNKRVGLNVVIRNAFIVSKNLI